MQVKYLLTFAFFYHNVLAQSNEDENAASTEYEVVTDKGRAQYLLPKEEKEEVVEDEKVAGEDNLKFPNGQTNEDESDASTEHEVVTDDKGQAPYLPPKEEKEEQVVEDEEVAGEDTFKFPNGNKDYEAEQKAGDPADLFGTNQHHSYPDTYRDLGRRFVLQYPYKVSNTHLRDDDTAEANLDITVKTFQNEREANRLLKPVKAPPELVLAVARESALLEAAKTINPSNKMIQKDILRSGNYWNDVWKEEVDPKILRTQNDDNNMIESVKVKIMPGSKLYHLVSALKKISPRLIYVINKN